jgi:hypothetical protein
MDNRTTEACVEREDAESDTSSARYEERTSYRFGLTGHFEANCVQFNRARVHRNKVNKETASASLGKAEDRDLIGLGENATSLTAASAPAAWVIDSRGSHHMCDDRNRSNSIKILRQPIVIEFGDNNNDIVNHHGLVTISQEYKVNALYTPTFRLSLFFINQLDIARYTSTFRHGKCSV